MDNSFRKRKSLSLKQLSVITWKSEEHQSSKLEDTLISIDVLMI